MIKLFLSSIRRLSSHNKVDLKKILPILHSVVPSDRISVSKSCLEQHSHDESYHRNDFPSAVVFVESVKEVSSVVRVCNEYSIPVIPFGTGTGLEGGVTAPFGGVCIDLNGLNQIVSVNNDDFDCTVQAGVTRKTLNNYLRDSGLWFPVDPGADASLCGMCATSASGTNAVRYGTMKENVLNLQVVLPNGEIIHTRGQCHRSRKSSAGYNLTNLFVGSEGTLGIITEATLKLYGIPENMAAAVTSFQTVQAAVDAVVQILQSCIPIARIEFLDDVQMDACNKYSHLNYPIKPTLFLEFHGSTLEVKAQATLAGSCLNLFSCEICTNNGGHEFKWSANQTEREILWKARHDAYYAGLALRPNSRGYITDVCVPISKLTKVLVETKNDILQSDFIGPIVGHVGDGNFHVILLVNPENEDETKRAHSLSDRIVKYVIQFGDEILGKL